MINVSHLLEARYRLADVLTGSSSTFKTEVMREALGMAVQAYNLGEVPVGAVVVRQGIILSQAHNLREALSDPTAHAERLALTLAGQSLGTWRLDDCDLYVTLEPCPMCAGAIVQARVRRVFFGASDRKAGACKSLYRIASDPRLNHRSEVFGGILEEQCSEILTRFFEERRDRAMPPHGGVPEWLKGPVSKTGVPVSGTVGSNPTSSA